MSFINPFEFFSQGKTWDVHIESDKQWPLRSWQWWRGELLVEEREEEVADEEGGEQQVVLEGRREKQQRPPGLLQGAETGEWFGELGGEEERWLLTSAFDIALYRFYNDK